LIRQAAAGLCVLQDELQALIDGLEELSELAAHKYLPK